MRLAFAPIDSCIALFCLVSDLCVCVCWGCAAAQTTEAQSEVKMIRPRIIRSRRTRTRNGLPVIFHTAKRYRQSDAIVPRPRWNRHDPHTPRRMSQRLIAGMALRNAEHVAYDRLEAYCSTRLPEMYAKYCRPVLRKFRRITEALSYGDRVSHACMAIGLCKRDSYVTQSPRTFATSTLPVLPICAAATHLVRLLCSFAHRRPAGGPQLSVPASV
jgi:hypothetical protein